MKTFLQFIEEQHLYHGGKRLVSKPSLDYTQQRDRGFYGNGFYTTSNPKHAGMYGHKISKYEILPHAKVLHSAIHPRDAHPDHIEDVVKWHDSTGREAAKVRGKESEFDWELNRIRTNHSDWHHAVDKYATHHGYDIVHYSDRFLEGGETVVKNPNVLKYVGRHKT